MPYSIAVVAPEGHDAYGKDGLPSFTAAEREVEGLVSYARSQARFTGAGMADFRIEIDKHTGGCGGECVTADMGIIPPCHNVRSYPLAADPVLG